MNTETTPKRHLSDLTAAECQLVFLNAFGYVLCDDRLQRFCLGPSYPLTIRDGVYELILYPSGNVLASRGQEQAVFFNAFLTIQKLADYNVVFGVPPIKAPGQ